MTDDTEVVREALEQLAALDHLRLAAPPACRRVSMPYVGQCELLVKRSQTSPSLGWILMAHYQSCAHAAALTLDGAHTLFRDPFTLVAGAGRGNGSGQWRDGTAEWVVDGRWELVSGAPFATHVLLQFETALGSQIAFVPRGSLTVPAWSDWSSTGLRATGSVTVTASSASVPTGLVAPAQHAQLQYDLPRRRLGPGLVVTGAAFAALRTIEDHIAGGGVRPEWLRGDAAADRLGRATAGVLAAQAWLHGLASRMEYCHDAEVEAERRLAEAFAFEAAIAAALIAVQAAGVAGLSPGSPVARLHADILAAGAHIDLQPRSFLTVIDLLRKPTDRETASPPPIEPHADHDRRH